MNLNESVPVAMIIASFWKLENFNLVEFNLRATTTRDSIEQQILSFCALMKVNLPAEII